MGYRLHASIPNVKPYDEDVELGKQYDSKWDSFNDEWFGENVDKGMVPPDVILNFYNAFITIDSMKGEYKMGNLEMFKEMVMYAIEHQLKVYFESY